MAFRRKYWLSFIYHYYNFDNEEIAVRREDYEMYSFNKALELFKKVSQFNVLCILADKGLERRFTERVYLDIFGCRLTVCLSDDCVNVFEDFYAMSDKAVIDDELPF